MAIGNRGTVAEGPSRGRSAHQGRPAPIYTQGNFDIMENRTKSKSLAAKARRLINTLPELAYIANSQANIVYLTSDLEKKKGNKCVMGQCEKVPDKYRWIVPYDFMITLYLPNVERLNKKQMRILLLHELLHIGIELDGNEEKYSVREHDYEEFRMIIDRYGLDWSDDEQA